MTKIKEILQKIALVFWGAVSLIVTILLFVGMMWLGSVKSAPDYAQVLTVQQTKIFYPATPLYFKALEQMNIKYDVMTLKEARQQGFKMDDEARNKGYFVQDGVGKFFSSTSRWDKDGKWNIKFWSKVR